MSSEQFEHYEYEFDNINKSITRKINTQLPNYTGGVCISTPCGFFFFRASFCVVLTGHTWWGE